MPLIIGLCGGTGSGKTTMAEAILRRSDPQQAVIIHQDSYYRAQGNLPLTARAQCHFDHPDAFDWPLLLEPSKRYADIIFPEGGHNKIAIEVMISRINSQLQQTGKGT